MFEFFGHFHPVIVHLPIGILLVAILLQWMARRPAYVGLRQAVRILYGLGVLAGVASCVTGYLLSLSGDYDTDLVDTHMWMAISLTLVAGFLYVRSSSFGVVNRVLSLVAVVLVLVTGHLGGSLTHGPGYLTAGLTGGAGAGAKATLRPVANIDSAGIYTDLVQPVLHDNCYRCHSADKQKGGLRLDGPELIMKGGKDGKVVLAGRAAGSELIKRLVLPVDDEHHMAPKGKQQLTKEELALLTWWVNTGVSFDKKVGLLPRDSAMAPVLLAFKEGKAGPVAGGLDGPKNVADSELIFEAMPAAPPAAVIATLRAAGVVVAPISKNSSYLEVRLPGDSPVGPVVLQGLLGLKDQLLSLRGSGSGLNDSAMSVIGQCKLLVRLWLDHTAVTGKGLGDLRTLTRLRYLNLSGTGVGNADLLVLKSLPRLATLYVYQTRVDKRDWSALQGAFPHTRIDSGGYVVGLFATDTMVVKAPTVR
jgi:mono/diheme cytochrome c family protein